MPAISSQRPALKARRDGTLRRARKKPPQSTVERLAGRAEAPEPAPKLSSQVLRKAMHWSFGLLLLPLCAVLLVVLLKMILWLPPKGSWHEWSTLWFAAGAVLALASMHLLPKRWLMLFYVAGHEWTHWLFVRACLGKTGEVSIHHTGGFVMASKSNWLINLSPYFFPFWSVLSCALFVPLSLAFSLDGPKTLLLWGHAMEYHWWWFAVAGLGLLWTKHIVYTLRMIHAQQPDLHEQGTFCSLIVIVFFNLLVMNLLYVSVAGSLSLEEWGRWISHNLTRALRLLVRF